MTATLAATLTGIVGDRHVLTDPDTTAPFERDWTGRFGARSRLVVRPRSTEETAEVVTACAAERAAVVTQGGNTGLVGGGVPRGGEVVLSTTRLDEIADLDVDAMHITAGAGVTLAALHAGAAQAGLAYGVDFAARDSATVGGSVATNAGGLRVVRHGPTRGQLLGVEAVLADGQVLRRLGGLPKDATGYDLTGLLCGSEGTLAIVTRARLRLVPRDGAEAVALCGVGSTADAIRLLLGVRRLPALAALEWFHADEMALVREHAGLPEPLAKRYPTYVLVACAGADDPTDGLLAALDGSDAVDDAAVAADRPGRAALWAYRERLTESIAASGTPHKLDVALPLGDLERFENVARGLCAKAGARLFLFGHLAEGNVHVNVVGPAPDDERLDDAILRLVAELGGSISAEHGVGIAKRRWLALTRSDVDRATMLAIKRALDPAGLLNPGVLLA